MLEINRVFFIQTFQSDPLQPSVHTDIILVIVAICIAISSKNVLITDIDQYTDLLNYPSNEVIKHLSQSYVMEKNILQINKLLWT